MKIPQDLKKPLRAAEKAGWTLSHTKGSHLRLQPPAGLTDPLTGSLQPALIFSGSPSDPRSHKNTLAALKRAGVTW